MLSKLIKNSPFIFWIILICSLVTYVYGRIVFDSNPIVLGESLSFWTYGLASIKESFIVFHQFPLWDSHIGSGFSLIGHPYIQQFYPLIYPFIFLIQDPILATRFFIFFHIILASIFFFFLASSLGIRKLAAFLGVMAYINSLFFYLYLVNGFFSSIFTITWLPLILLFFIRAIQTHNKRFIVVAAFLIALIIFAGGLYSVLFTFVLLGIFFIIYSVKTVLEKKHISNKMSEIKHLLMVIFLLAIFSILFSLADLIPVLEYRAISNREEISLLSAESNLSPTLPLREIISSVSIYFVPQVQNVKLNAVILGIFLFFVLLSLFSQKKLLSLGLLTFTILAIIAALGNRFYLDIYSIFYYFVPGFKSFGSTTRFLVLTWFTLPLLAALGFEVFMRVGGKKIHNVQKLTSFLIVIIFVGTIIVNQKKSIEMYKFPLYEIPKSAQYIKELERNKSKSFRTYNKWIAGPHSGFNYAAIQNNLSVVSSLYVGAVPNYKQLDFVSRENNILNLEKKYKLFSILNTKYIVSSKGDQDPQTKYTKIIKTVGNSQEAEEGFINEMIDFRSRINFFSTGMLLIGDEGMDVFNAIKTRSIVFLPEYDIYSATIFSGSSSCLEDYSPQELERFAAIILYKNKIKNKKTFQNILKKYIDKGGKVIQGPIFEENLYVKREMPNSLFTDHPAFNPKENLREELRQILKIKNLGSSSFEILRKNETPGNIEIHFSTREKGLLVLSESFYPGWEAKMDGKSITLFMADSIVKGVVVKDLGEHTLILSYKPKSFLAGCVLSGVAILFILAFFVKKLRKRTD